MKVTFGKNYTMEQLIKYQNLSRKECGHVYLTVLENAKDLYEDADILGQAKKDKFGRPISLMILGLEEQIKALILFLDNKGFDFRQTRGLAGIFNNHELRYCASFIIFAANTFIEDLDFLINRLLKYAKDKKTSDFEEIKIKVEKNMDRYGKMYGIYLIKKWKLIFEEIEWFTKTGFLRESGFYVDYENGLRKPSDLTKEDYLGLRKRIDSVNDFCEKIMTELNSDNEFINKALPIILKHAKSKNLYAKISQYISKARQSKRSVLELIIEEFPFVRDIEVPRLEDSIVG